LGTNSTAVGPLCEDKYRDAATVKSITDAGKPADDY